MKRTITIAALGLMMATPASSDESKWHNECIVDSMSDRNVCGVLNTEAAFGVMFVAGRPTAVCVFLDEHFTNLTEAGMFRIDNEKAIKTNDVGCVTPTRELLAQLRMGYRLRTRTFGDQWIDRESTLMGISAGMDKILKSELP
ncbi:hypothetical protein G5V57_23425 [Nordella sp. HKS 07]|uniref:hypothetical protein n=1 Tax=Nordella sp. HKS 07 TaxID=2712222 RepID=UPI0013E1C6CB|nr:hypothetical protein [Nordella sp. HKS 07]QIG50421.1 hypothetical protein G5V57_23425 [Nordella sp. HKS 07]